MSEKHAGSISLSRRSFVAGAGVVALSCSLGSVGPLFERAYADDASALAPGASDASGAAQTDPQNYFSDPTSYQAFGLNTSNVPEDFNGDTSNDPLAGFTTLEPRNLYVGYVNRTGANQGNYNVADSIEVLSPSTAKLDAMTRTSLGGSALNTDWKTYQYHANDACTLNFDGSQVIVSNTIYTGTEQSGHAGQRESGQDIQVTRFTNGNPETIFRIHHSLACFPDSLMMEHIQQEGSLGLLAMATGDFYSSGSGNDDLAVYNPYPPDPHIVFYRYDNRHGEMVKGDIIHLSDLSSSFAGPFSDWRLPIVHLATFPHDGYDDLVVNVSLPLTGQAGLGDRAQAPVLAIYSAHSQGGTGSLRAVFRNELAFGGYRMRFASALATDLNENGVPELIVAGHYNGYSSYKDVGWMDSGKNLVQMVTYDWREQTKRYEYQNVWTYPKQVDALDDVYVQYEMCEPAALATGKFQRDQRNELFVEGCVFTLSSDGGNPASTEADLFRNGDFSSRYRMSLTGNRNHFIKKALSGNFAKTNIGTEQLIVQSGAVGSSNYTISYDVRWVYEQNGSLTTHDTDPSFIDNKKTDDDGTFLTLAACDINQNNAVRFKLESKSFGWSAPQPLAVLCSVPYWSDLAGYDTYEVGATQFGINTTIGTSDEVSWKVGGGFNVSGDLLFGVGLLGTDVNIGGGFDFDAMIGFTSSYCRQYAISQSASYQEKAGRDMVVCSATPLVVYEYSVYVPAFTVTQAYLDEYNKHAPAGKEWPQSRVGTQAGDAIVPYKVINVYEPALSMLTLQKYNEAATQHGGTDIAPIDMSAVLAHAQGDPTSYPSLASDLKSVHNNGKALITGKSAAVGANEGTSVTLETSVTETTEFSNGFDLTVGGGLSIKASAEASIGLSFSASGSAGFRLEVGAGESFTVSNSKGATFTTELPSLPNDCGAYSYAAQPIIWQTDAIAGNPVVMGYVVTGTGAGSVPRSLPLYPLAYSVSEDSIVWAWSNNTTRPAGAYGLALPTSTGSWTVPAANVIDGGEIAFIQSGLAAGQSQQVRFQAYNDRSQTMPSALGPIVVGATIGSDVPDITQQPQNVSVRFGDKAQFSVTAASRRGETLSYQWYHLDKTDPLAYVQWKPVVGATGSDYLIESADTLQSDTLYCVDVMDQTPDGNGVVPTVRSQPARLWVEPTSTNADPNAAAATLKTAPTVSLELTPTDGSTVVQHRDEFFVPYGGKFDMTFTVKDAFGNPCTGSINMAVSTYENGTCRNGTKNTYALTNGSSETFPATPLSDSTTWPPMPSGSQGARVFQVEASLALNGSSYDTLLPINEFFIINYGAVNIERAAHYFECETDGVLPGGAAYATSRFMPLPDIAPALVGAAFSGWFIDADLASPLAPQTALLPGTTTLFSSFTPHRYAVDYELNGGTNSPDNPSSLTNDDPAVTLSVPTRDGYAFEGWFADADFAEPAAVLPRGATGDIALHAKWAPIDYYVYYSPFGGTNPASNPVSFTVLDGELSIAPPQYDDAEAGTNAWYDDSFFTQKAAETIPAGSIGSVVLYGHAEPSEPQPGPSPEPQPTPEPGSGSTPASTDPAQPKPLVRTGDKQGPLHFVAVALVTAGAALAASLGFRGKRS